MGKQKNRSLAVEPFPVLNWDGFFWTTTINLTTWKGFQCRLGPYASRHSAEPSDGTTRLSVHSPTDDEHAPPSPEQAAAYLHLTTRQKSVQDAILKAVFDEYPSYREAYNEDYDLSESNEALPVLDRPDQLRRLIGLSGVLIHNVVRERMAYVGYEFGCAWDEEHGLGAMMHGDRVVRIGGADVGILEWIAEEDAKKTRRKRGHSGSE